MILFKGKRIKSEWGIRNPSLPTNSIAQMTTKGSMNSETKDTGRGIRSQHRLLGSLFSQNQENNDPNNSDATNANENLVITPQENEDPNDSNTANASESLVIPPQQNEDSNESNATDASGNQVESGYSKTEPNI
ncbi:unnamed protein product [Euphydryas editha]|uniref:Uncharacterized protein n=1 Tax=Euphydryas editha TaxID=104508 RepID=A0AAU9V1H8_EUPED|nr:unnamed protein product [Euphydryas editha]